MVHGGIAIEIKILKWDTKPDKPKQETPSQNTPHSPAPSNNQNNQEAQSKSNGSWWSRFKEHLGSWENKLRRR